MKLTEDEGRGHLDSYNKLSLDQRIKCHECGQPLGKAFCDRCDEFYNTGHKPDCSQRIDRGIDHSKCRRVFGFG